MGADLMRYGSLCTGIGGLDLAVEAYWGAVPVWHSEIEEAPCRVLERHWPGVPNLGDLTVVDWSQVEPVDILTAGYPCQPFSHAGRRKGTDDHRHLWPYVAAAVRVLRPRWVVLENVSGHLSLGFGRVLGDLAEAGFDVQWASVRASSVGAPHRRERVFIVAHTDAHHVGREGAEPRAWRNDGRGDPRPAADTRGAGTGRDDRAVPGAAGEGAPGGSDPNSDGVAGSAPVTVDRRPGEVGEPGEVERAERLRGVAAPDADHLGLQGRHDPGSGEGLGAQGHEPPGADPTLAIDWGRYQPAIDRWSAILGRPAPHPVDDRGRLNPPFVEWMMGYPGGWVDGLTRTQALKALGNAVVARQALAAIDELVPAFELEVAA